MSPFNTNAQKVKKKIRTNNRLQIFSARYSVDAQFLTPKCPKNKENDPNKLRMADVSEEFDPFHYIEKESSVQTIRSLEVNWAVGMNLINKMSKVITNDQSITSLSKV